MQLIFSLRATKTEGDADLRGADGDCIVSATCRRIKKQSRSRTVCGGSDRDAGVATGWRVGRHSQRSHERVKRGNTSAKAFTSGPLVFAARSLAAGALLPADKLSLKPNSSANRARQSLGKCLGNQPPLVTHWPGGGCSVTRSARRLLALADAFCARRQKKEAARRQGCGRLNLLLMMSRRLLHLLALPPLNAITLRVSHKAAAGSEKRLTHD